MSGARGNHFFDRAYQGVNGPDDCRDMYDEWAKTYDADLLGETQEYVAPVLTAKTVMSANGNVAGKILDAGCGTGLAGMALQREGAKTIDGLDISPEMLKLAEKTGAYRSLEVANLNQEIPKPDNAYDIVTCVGTFTQGHVKPSPALKEFVRVTKSDGIVVATIRSDIWESDGYAAEVERLKESGLVDVVGAEDADYRKGVGVKARMLILRKR